MNDSERPGRQVEIGDFVCVGHFKDWMRVADAEGAEILVLELSSGATIKAHRSAISEHRRPEGLARMARDMRLKR